MSQIASFRARLAPLLDWLDDPTINEIVINRPREIWIAKKGERYMQQVSVPDLSYHTIASLSAVTAAYTNQEADKKKPLLSAIIPINLQDDVPDSERGGYRVQVVKSPAVEHGTMAFCIRKSTLLDFSLSDYTAHGAFADTNKKSSESDIDLTASLKGDWENFLRAAIQQRKNIVISAGTNAGKTTLLNALIKEVPLQERIVTIEDTREIRLPHKNCLHLVYSRGMQGESNVTAVDLLEATLRLTPDRPIMGELRGAEAYSYLELLNSGHSGSITTIHADSPMLMYDRLAQMVMRFGSPLGKDQIIEYARSLINIVIQIKRDADGRRYVSEILYDCN